MGIFRKGRLSAILQKIFGKKHAKIGIYGPPNVGKTTLANRILRDWTGDIMGSVSEIPHETRRAKWKKDVRVENNASSLLMDIVDTPGIATSVDYREFQHHGLSRNDSIQRAKEATRGVIKAIQSLDSIDAAIVVVDAARAPFDQINWTVIGNLEARKIPIIVAANKTDLAEADPTLVQETFQSDIIPISAKDGSGMNELYGSILSVSGM